MRTSLSFVVMSVALLAVPGCTSTEPFLFSDVDLARGRWLKSRPSAYVFDIDIRTAMLPPTGFVRVEVENGVVLEATDVDGNLVENFILTVDSLWIRLLDARDRGELNSARFDLNGVPRDFDHGPWALDGGVGYTVRNFVRRN